MEFHPRRLKEGVVDLDYRNSGGATQTYHEMKVIYPQTKGLLFKDDMQEERGERDEKSPREVLLSILKSKLESHGYVLQVLSLHQAMIKKKSENLEEKL